MATFHSLSPLLLFLFTEQQCKVCAVSVIVSVKTFIMIMTNNDDDDYIHGYVYIPRPYSLLHVTPCIQTKKYKSVYFPHQFASTVSC